MLWSPESSGYQSSRIAANAAVVFLILNDWEPLFSEEELIHVVLSVASGLLIKQKLTEVFENRCQPRLV